MKTVLAVICAGVLASTSAAQDPRSYYSGWTSHPQGYYSSYYYYKPTVTTVTYSYHYAIHYPAQPTYVYYYNPYSQVYWGRLDTSAKGDDKYSILDEKDRKKDLKDIPESAFPKLAKMPAIPDSKDGEQMIAPKELPKIEKK